jgi:zinc transport system ATP-binding protein
MSQVDTPSPAIDYHEVTFAYRTAEPERRPVLENVTLQVAHGERLGILGPNGGGKSTLLKLTLGLLRGASGRIRVCGLEPDTARRRRLMGYVPQRFEAELALPISVRQVVGLAATVGLPPWRGGGPETSRRVEECLALVGAADLADRPVGSLSGGQLQRVMIARAVVFRPRILLMDEPTVGIDVVGQRQFAELLTRLHDELDLTIVVVSHDIRTVVAGCDRIACLSGTLHFHAAPQGLTPAVLAEVFRHDVAAIYGDVHVEAHPAATCTDPTHAHHAAPCPETERPR